MNAERTNSAVSISQLITFFQKPSSIHEPPQNICADGDAGKTPTQILFASARFRPDPTQPVAVAIHALSAMHSAQIFVAGLQPPSPS